MKRINVEIKNGKVNLDFEGFAGKTCANEEDVIRTLYGRMGVKTDVEHSDNKREAEANGTAERERNGY
jgi:hypothetical protein